MCMTTYYILYKTTNLVNGKIYIGIHSTTNIDDGYLGSGKLLLKAIKKYGAKSFRREILAQVSSTEELEKLEIEVVTEDFCKRDDVYNIMPGGKWESKDRNGLSFAGKSQSVESITKMVETKKLTQSPITEETRKKLRDSSFSKSKPEEQRAHASRAGKIGGAKPKSEEHRKKISETMKKVQAARRGV